MWKAQRNCCLAGCITWLRLGQFSCRWQKWLFPVERHKVQSSPKCRGVLQFLKAKIPRIFAMRHFPALLSPEVFWKVGGYRFGSTAKKCSAGENYGNVGQIRIRWESLLCPEVGTGLLGCCPSLCGRVPSCGTCSPAWEPPGLAGFWGRGVPRLWVQMVSRRLLLLPERLGVLSSAEEHH